MAEKETPQKTADLTSIGLLLRKKREEHSYTLEHVAEHTRITLTSIRNIEEGNLEALPGLVFVRGFVRNYARLLGVESDWMIEVLNQAYSSPTQSKLNKEETAEVPTAGSGSRIKYALVGAVACVVVVAFLLYWNNSISTNTQFSDNADIQTIQAVETAVLAENEGQTASEPENIEIVEPENPQVTKTVISPLTLTLVAKEDEWIRLMIDKQEPFELMLEKKEKYEWPAEEEYNLTMTTGNSASIHLNGEEIIDRENFSDQLFQVKFNKFTLTRINNQ